MSVEVLDKSLVNIVMEEEDVTPQTVYELTIPAGTLSVTSRLRISVILSRVIGTPLASIDLSCCLSTNETLPQAQELTQTATLTPPAYGAGSFGYVGESNGQSDIYQAVYANEATLSGGTFDTYNNFKIWHIIGNEYSQSTKIATASTNELNGGNLINGKSDEPVYAISFGVSFFSNAPSGLYLYFINTRSQVYVPSLCDTWSVSDDIIYTSEGSGISPTFNIKSFNKTGTLLASSAVLAPYGNTLSIQAFSTSVYCLVASLTSGNTIVQLDKATLQIQHTWELGNSGYTVRAIEVVSNSLIYFIGGDLVIGYLVTSTGQVVIIDSSVTHTFVISYNDGVVFPNRVVLHFQRIGNLGQGNFYYADAGGRIYKIALNCSV